MSSDKIKGVANEAVGNIKQGIGKILGNEKMQAEGVAQELKGEGQQAMGDAKETVKKGSDKARKALGMKS
jgi:uncharacterized protein YjbJ (UPF0337 family)